MTGTRPPLSTLIAVLAVALCACRQDQVDAYGNFEATEVTVAAEVGGRLLALTLEEGDRVEQGVTLGTIDTLPLVLERRAVVARRAAGASRAREANATIASLEVQLDIAERDLARTQRLLQNAAATAQQGDRAEREARVAKEELAGARVARTTLIQELAVLDAQVQQIDDRLARSQVASPLQGTVLARYAEAGEYVQAGQPLFKLASLDSLTFRAYVSGAQLANLRLGQPVSVGVDRADSIATLPGRIVWIASAAEFTPTPIQTREERADQVYAVKVAVENADGVLKIGMPGELVLEAPAEEQVGSK
jgi:HlyD family secretion protein